MGTKLIKLFANRVIERRNMIMYISGGDLALRVLGGVDFRGSFEFYDFEFFLALLCHFAWLDHFSCLLLAFTIFLLLDDLFELFLTFWSSTCASCGLGFELQIILFFVINGPINRKIEKPSDQFLSLIVMSH
jgi:hypothetical protein